MSDDDKPTCATCRFFEGAGMICRVKAPTVVPSELGGTYAAWPEVSAQDWCGQHQPNAPTNHLPTEFKA